MFGIKTQQNAFTSVGILFYLQKDYQLDGFPAKTHQEFIFFRLYKNINFSNYTILFIRELKLSHFLK